MVGNKYALVVFRLIVGGVFVWSGMLKILDPLGFARNVAAYEILPQWMCLFVGVTLPWVEVAAGLFLLAGFFRRGAALVAAALLASFIVLVSGTMIRGLDLSCGCFGSLSGKVGWPLLVQDVVLFFGALCVFLSRDAFFSLDRLRPRP